MSIKLPTYRSFTGSIFFVTQTADLGSFDDTFQQRDTFGQQTADLGSFDGTYQQNSKVSIKLSTSGSFNGAIFSSLNLPTLAFLMVRNSQHLNCRFRQF